MKELSAWCILLCLKFVSSSPYYYRESKHHSEHHKEYSSGNGEGGGQTFDSFQDVDSAVPDLAVGKPERYSSSYVFPTQVSGYGQSHSGGYSFSSGGNQRYMMQSTPVVSSQHFSIQSTPVISSHYSIQSSPVISSRLIQQTDPVLVKQRIVKVYSYPATSTHSGYFQIKKSATGNLETLQPFQTESSLSQHQHSTGSLMAGQKEERGWEGQSMFGEGDGQSEIHEESGQTQFGDSFELGQKEEHIQLGRTMHSHYNQEHGGLEVGQKEESFEFGQKEEPIPDQNYKKVEHYSHSQKVEVGQKEESLYPKHEQDFFGQGQKEESLGELELGQREEPVSGQNYKKVEHYSHSQKIEVGQKEESLYPESEKDFLDQGQKEESTGQLEFGQREEPIPDKYYIPKQQYAQSHILEVGQKEESLYTKPIKDELKDLGQKEISIGQTDIGQQQQPIPYHNYKQTHSSHIQKLEVGQKEESFGQREEPVPNHYALKPGPKEESLYEIPVKDIETQEQSLYDHNYKKQGHNTEHKQATHFEDSQKEESLIPQSDELDLGQKEDNLQGVNFESHHRREESHYKKQGSIELGQKQEEGQKEFFTGYKPDDLGRGKEKEGFPQPTYSSIEVDRKPILIQSQNTRSSLKKEETLYQKHGSEDLEIGQKEVPYDDIGQREETLSLSGSGEFGQQEIKESSHHESKSVHTVGQTGIGFVPALIVSPHSHQHGMHRHHSHVQESPGYQQGFGFQPCEHGEQYQHGGFGLGQNGHNEELVNANKDKEITGFYKDGFQRHYLVNRGDDSKQQGHTYSTTVTKNKTTIEVHRSGSKKPIFVPIVPKVTKVSEEEFGKEKVFNLDKKVEDLAMQLELEGISKPSQSTTIAQTIQHTRTIPSTVHNAEIQELGSENFDIRSSLRPIITRIDSSGTPEGRVNVFETHKEEVGYGPSSQRTYSKKHSRQYSIKQESHSSLPPQDIEQQLEKLLSQTGGNQQSSGVFQSTGGHQSSGGWYSSYSRAYSSGDHSGSLTPQDESHHRISRESDRGSDIDAFLSELDKEIARENKKKGNQGGFVQVSPQYTSGQSGTYHSEKTVTSHTSQSSSSSGSSGVSTWFKKIGDGISSTYNKAKEKAKDIVSNVKDQMG